MMKMVGKTLWFLWLLVLTLSFSLPVQAGSSYVGTWQRTAKYVNGALQNNTAATLVLTETSYSSITPAPPEEACAFTGSMVVQNQAMRVTVNVSACPEIVPVSEVQSYLFAVTDSGGKLTTTRTVGSEQIKQVYHRQKGQMGGSEAETQCSHPLCGTWNRTATYVNNALMHNTGAYTVITEKTYYSIAPRCFNTLTIDSITGNAFTMTMVSHNCPTAGRGIEPGTVVNQTFSLTNEGNTLTVINTEYGAEVKTVFRRLH